MLYPINVVTFLKIFSKKDHFDVLTNVFILLDDRKYNGMIKSIIDHNPAGEKQIWLLQREHYYLHQKCGAAGAVGYNALLSPVTEFQNTLANLGLFIRRSCKKIKLWRYMSTRVVLKEDQQLGLNLQICEIIGSLDF